MREVVATPCVRAIRSTLNVIQVVRKIKGGVRHIDTSFAEGQGIFALLFHEKNSQRHVVVSAHLVWISRVIHEIDAEAFQNTCVF